VAGRGRAGNEGVLGSFVRRFHRGIVRCSTDSLLFLPCPSPSILARSVRRPPSHPRETPRGPPPRGPRGRATARRGPLRRRGRRSSEGLDRDDPNLEPPCGPRSSAARWPRRCPSVPISRFALRRPCCAASSSGPRGGCRPGRDRAQAAGPVSPRGPDVRSVAEVATGGPDAHFELPSVRMWRRSDPLRLVRPVRSSVQRRPERPAACPVRG